MSSDVVDGVMSTKRSLVVLSHAMERSLAVRVTGEARTPSLVVGLFQRRRYFEREIHRYAALAAGGTTCIVAFQGDVGDLPRGVHGVELARDDPDASVWALVVLDGSLGTTLAAGDVEGLSGAEDDLEGGRLFRARWSFSRDRAAEDAARLLDRLGRSLPEEVEAAARYAVASCVQVPAQVAEARLAVVTDTLVGSLDRAHMRSASLRRELERARSQSEQDPMTGVYNRRYLDRFLDAGASRSTAQATMLVDVDDLKRINDSRGHDAGDAAIVAVAETLVSSTRPHDVVCRIGGDEFLVVMPGLDAEDAAAVADRTVDAVGSLQLPHPWADLRLGVSIGVAVSGPSEIPVARLDDALYAVKRAGKGRAAVADVRPRLRAV